MPASKKDLIKDIVEIQQEMMKTFHDLLLNTQPLPTLHTEVWRPPTDVYEDANAFVVRMEIPGVGQDDIKIAIENDRLIIQGRRIDPARKNKVQFRQMEINYGRFQRVIPLPDPVDESQIQATYNDGFLEVVLVKLTAKKITKIIVGKSL